MRIRVHVAVDVIGEPRALAGSRLAHLRIVEMGRGLRGGGELRGELADHQVRAPALDEPEHRGVPEQGRAAVADQHFVAVGKREQVGHPVADPPDDGSHAVLAMAGAEVSGRGVGERGDRLVRHLRRTGAEAPVAAVGEQPGSRSSRSRGAGEGCSPNHDSERLALTGSVARLEIEVGVALRGLVEQRRIPDRMTGRGPAEQLELARRGSLGERDPAGRRRFRLMRVIADPVLTRDLESETENETRGARVR